MSQTNTQRHTWGAKKQFKIGIYSMIFLFAVLVLWGMNTRISGAVVAKGKIQVSSNRTALQHPTGGVVAEVLAENGDKVIAGDIVVRLDDTKLRSDLKTVEGELFEILANGARLEAEIDDRKVLIIHPILQNELLTSPEISLLLERQQNQLDSFYETYDTEKRLLEEQIRQVESQIIGVEAELTAKTERVAFVDKELLRVQKLEKEGLVTSAEIRTFQKDQIKTKGDIGKLTARVAELKGKLETELKLNAISPTMKDKSVENLNRIQRERSKFLERRYRIIEDLSKLDIRTPVDGKIHDSQILGLRSVIVAAKPIMFVVPTNKPVTVAVQVDVTDIGQVYLGQMATVKFTSFHTRAMPNIFATVSKVSADAFLDTKTQKWFYKVEVSLTAKEIEKLGNKPLISGMPASVFLSTKSSTPLEYMLRPMLVYFDSAMRDS